MESNFQYWSAEPQPSLRRIGSETEPPNLATETNAGCGVFQARNPKSPVRNREGLAAKTPRNRGDFSGCARVRAGNLCNSRLNGGESGIRTHGTFQYTRFPSVRLKPLGHLSESFLLLAGAGCAPAAKKWRRGRDSNPRWVSPHTPLAGERLQPLGHLSRRGKIP